MYFLRSDAHLRRTILCSGSHLRRVCHYVMRKTIDVEMPHVLKTDSRECDSTESDARARDPKPVSIGTSVLRRSVIGE
ncbi:hypothetical protein COLO4_04433 [Corchorus olitorius]|uniref:Uncharacterized protein n=2 Tax=Corchorus olitorius TaxID=93759 RepID=A0A1R3KTZ1_9ROSI|nr:hypothetical protein COLO4_04433 [Corchorus olitorius]